MNAPYATSPGQKICPSCSTTLDAATAFCVRCGQPQAMPPSYASGGYASPQRSGSSVGIIVVAVVGGAMVLIAILGILAAIAIPNFLRYQLRAKQSEQRMVLSALVKAETVRASETGSYLPVSPMPAGDLGTAKRVFAPSEQEVARELDLATEGALYGQYSVAVAEAGEGGKEAASFCAEADIDGDGDAAVFVAFLPAPQADGTLSAPPAPCGHQLREYAYEGQTSGTVVQVTGPNVF